MRGPRSTTPLPPALLAGYALPMPAFSPQLTTALLGNVQPVSKGDYKAALGRSGAVILHLTPHSKLTLAQIGGILHNPDTTADRARQILAGMQVVSAQMNDIKTRQDVGTVAQYHAQRFMVASGVGGVDRVQRALTTEGLLHGYISAFGAPSIRVLGEIYGGAPDLGSCAWSAWGLAASMLGCPDLEIPLPTPTPERIREAAKVFPNAARLLNAGFATRDTATISKAVTALRRTRAMAILQTWNTPHDAVIHPALHNQMSAATTLLLAAAAQAKALELPAAGHIAARCVFGLVETEVGDFGDLGADDGASSIRLLNQWIRAHEAWGTKTALKTPSAKSDAKHANTVNQLRSSFEKSLSNRYTSDLRAKILTALDAVGSAAQEAMFWDARLKAGRVTSTADTRQRLTSARTQRDIFLAELTKMVRG